jgi:hypothetical protein
VLSGGRAGFYSSWGNLAVLVSEKEINFSYKNGLKGLRDHSTCGDPVMDIGQKVEIFPNLEPLG